jgi:hypothetical protein
MKTKLPQPFRKNPRSRRGILMVDLVVAMAILTLTIVPLGFSFARERRALRAEYFRAAADEIVDGETEIYTVHSRAAANLPPGHFQLTKTGNHLRLAWTPDQHQGIGAVVREVNVK